MGLDIVLVALPDWVSSNPKMYFPLSLCYLAAVIKQAGHRVQIADFREKIGSLPEAEFYGFSCATPQIKVAKELATSCKVLYPNCKTIIGGAHASLMPDDCIGNFDYICMGEGEEVILDIMGSKVKNGTIIARRIRELDKVPYPAWDLIENPFSETLFPGERYGTGPKAMTVIGSRGCPFSCSFCGNMLHTTVVYRSVDNILGELKTLKSMGVNHFRFEDDNFTIHPEFELLCTEIMGLDIHYKCHTRSTLLTNHMAKMMKASGCEECGLGVESADNLVLKLANKKEMAEDHAYAVEVLHSEGLRAKTYFVAGLPGETDRTIELNKEFMRSVKPDKWTLSTFTPYPGSDIWKHPEKYGVTLLPIDFSNYWNFIPDHFNHIINGDTTENMWMRYVNLYQYMKGESWKE